MSSRYQLCLATVCLAFVSAVSTLSVFADDVRPPSDYLNRRIGTDFELADWSQVSGYYQELANRSPHVLLKSGGKTTEQRDFLYAVISSQQNLERLPEFKTYASWIADPRRCEPADLQTAIQQGKPFLFITPSMHSDEPASTEMGMQLAWQLATSEEQPWSTIREKLVVIILPSLNPDGVDHIVKWYRQHRGTAEEGSEMLKLYQYYTGHDNNRDWFSLTQQESKLLTRLLYHEWFPQVLWDPHQYGSQKERFFVPPYRDPLNPNLDPGIVAGINALGNRAILDMTNDGLTGIACGVSYDNWWNGGNRSVPCRHNIIGLLTEAASVNIASPVFVKKNDLKDPLGRSEYRPSNRFITPWKGGWWRLTDIHRYQLSFGESLMTSLAREPEYWLKNAADAATRCIEQGRTGSPRGWIIPQGQHDLTTLNRFSQLLIESGVELQVLTEKTRIAGHEYAAGTLLIGRDQPYGNYAKDLLEFKPFPKGERPYDVAGWSLGALFGIDVVTVREDLPTARRVVTSAAEAIAAYTPDPRLRDAPAGTLSTSDLASWSELARQLGRGANYRFFAEGHAAGLLVPEATANGAGENQDAIVLKNLPRVGVYAPWDPSMDEGWLRWMLDDAGFPFERLRNETVCAGRLGELYDVIILPDLTSRVLEEGRSAIDPELNYTGGLAGEGLRGLEEFVSSGGKLIACDSAANWLVKQWSLPVQDVTLAPENKSFRCSGSVVRSRPAESTITAGLPGEIPLMFAYSKAWELTDSDESTGVSGKFTSHLDFSETNLLMSGHIDSEEVIAGKSGWVSGSYGEGTIHLFGFRPHYRGWSQGTFGLLFRAIFL